MPEIYFLWDFGYWSRRERRGCGALVPDEVKRLTSEGYWELVKETKGKRVILISTSLGARLAREILEENGCQVTSLPWKNQEAIETHRRDPADMFLIDYWDQAAGADLVIDLVEKLKLAETPQQQIVL